jgi:hypothetical protein
MCDLRRAFSVLAVRLPSSPIATMMRSRGGAVRVTRLTHLVDHLRAFGVAYGRAFGENLEAAKSDPTFLQ